MRPSIRAFTLVEMLAVLAIAAVTLGLGLPALDEAVARHRLRAAASALLDTLGRARSRAVWHGRDVTVCASDDGRVCAPSSDWAHGWVTRDGDRYLVDRHAPLHARLASTRRVGRYAIAFAPNGTSRGTNQTVVLCLRGRPATAIAVVIGNAGLAHRETPDADEARACARAPSRKRKEA